MQKHESASASNGKAHYCIEPHILFKLPDLEREMLEAIHAFPGKKYAELAEIVRIEGKADVQAVRDTVYRLRERKLVNLRDGERTSTMGRIPRAVWPVTDDDPYDRKAGVQPMRKLGSSKAKTVDADATLVSDERRELDELRAFKRMAIERYPNLMIPRSLERARQIAAETMRRLGDTTMAAAIEAGQKDSAPVVVSTQLAIEEFGE